MSGCEALIGAALFACLARNPTCLPPQYVNLTRDLAAIAQQESGLLPFAIRDETTRESLFPATHADAVRIATERDAAGHTLGLGMFQITHRSNWLRHGLTIATALTGCGSMRAAASHYDDDLRTAALQLYNSGRIDGAPAYAASVLRRVQTGPQTSPAPSVVADPQATATPLPRRAASGLQDALRATPAIPDPEEGMTDAYHRSTPKELTP